MLTAWSRLDRADWGPQCDWAGGAALPPVSSCGSRFRAQLNFKWQFIAENMHENNEVPRCVRCVAVRAWEDKWDRHALPDSLEAVMSSLQ